jgi:hypothetical protein
MLGKVVLRVEMAIGFNGKAPVVPVLRSGEWRIEQVTLDDMPRLRVTCRGYLVLPGYFSTIEGVMAALDRDGGPSLADFEAEADQGLSPE